MSQTLGGSPTGENEIGSQKKGTDACGHRSVELSSRNLASCDDPQFLPEIRCATYCTWEVQEVCVCQK